MPVRSSHAARFICGSVMLACSAGAFAQPIGALSDEFDTAASLGRWQRVEQVEGWNIDQLAVWDVNVSAPGAMTMEPRTCTWFRDYRGPLAFKEVTGDFAITSAVRTTGLDGVSIPLSQYSLGGLMIRAPRAITPVTWTPGGENFVFLSLGFGDVFPRTFQFEVKTTVNSQSTLVLSPAPGPESVLQIARIGPHVIALRRLQDGSWVVHARYFRSDLPATLQAGMVAYTDWNKVQTFDPFVHNTNVLASPLPPGVLDPSPGVPFTPDVRTRFDYARFARPVVPPALIGADLSNPAAVSDAALIEFLGAALDVPAAPCGVDLNSDGVLNQEDLSGYISAFLDEGVPAGPTGTTQSPCPSAPAPYSALGYAADFNRDCNFDQEDLGGFITEYFIEAENPTNCAAG